MEREEMNAFSFLLPFLLSQPNCPVETSSQIYRDDALQSLNPLKLHTVLTTTAVLTATQIHQLLCAIT